MNELDYAVTSTIDVASARELQEAFGDLRGRPLRLVGHGTSQDRLPPPAGAVGLVCLAGLARIDRLDADDLTCSVQPGVRRELLDAELRERGLWLPCRGAGSVGGVFAADLCGPGAPGAPSPRTLLLGVEAVLAEGMAFKSGARVVKSVAGFDLQKAFVGSRGRLFAATLLHLKLRPMPPCIEAFDAGGLDRERALGVFRTLRRLSPPPVEVWLSRGEAGYRVSGRLAGHARHVAQVLRAIELPRSAWEPDDLSPARGSAEVVQGCVRPSRLGALLDVLPETAPVVVGGIGQFEVRLSRQQTDALLECAARVPCSAEVRAGAPARRGLGTAAEAGEARLADRLEQALDPHGMLR